jgi:hypothetical protein
MISRHIRIQPKHDRYIRLASYIAAIGPYEGRKQKPALAWCAGCAEGGDYAEGIAEVTDTQALNTRARNCKTYHLVVSFRPEDMIRLTPETLREIERRFAAVLGLDEHQRHCAFHVDTRNPHIQVAYNLIHPEKLTRHDPFQDYKERDKLCRDLEQEYGFAVDNGRGAARFKENETGKAVEKQRGEQSFASYVLERREMLIHALDAGTWQDFHKELFRHGLEIRLRGNGLVIKDRQGKQAVKASAVDRYFSLKKLEGRFGPFVPARDMEAWERERYQARPLHRSPERGNLFVEYTQGIEERKARLEAVKEREDAALADIRAQWAAKRKEIEHMLIAKKNRRHLLALARKHEAEAVAKTRLALGSERGAVRRDIPFTSWNGFLQDKAEQGSEIALAVLRSRKEAVAGEHEAAPDRERARRDRAVQVGQERALLEREDVSDRGKQRLMAVLRMEAVAKDAGISGFRHRVDAKGAVIFSLSGGGVIRDEGRELFFTAGNDRGKGLALAYARKKWGRKVVLEGNRIVREPDREKERGVSR